MRRFFLFIFFLQLTSFSFACVINWDPHSGTCQVDKNGKVPYVKEESRLWSFASVEDGTIEAPLLDIVTE